MRLLWTVLLAAAPAYGCSCSNVPTACSQVGGSTVIFVARVLVDSGEGMGTRPARVAIEEALQNVPPGLRETQINTSFGTSCYRPLKAGEKYVILTEARSYSVSFCSPSFQLYGNEHILDALRNAIRGGPSSLVGTVLKRVVRGGGMDRVSLVA